MNTSDKYFMVMVLTKHYAMKTYGAVEVKSQVFLTSALVRSEQSGPWPGRFIPRGSGPQFIEMLLK
jgi:hypothetical protein